MLNGHLSKAIKYQKPRKIFTLSDLLSNLNKPYSNIYSIIDRLQKIFKNKYRFI